MDVQVSALGPTIAAVFSSIQTDYKMPSNTPDLLTKLVPNSPASGVFLF